MERVGKELLRIVHVEDDDDFADLTSLFLKRAGFGRPIARCKDGADALDYLPMIEADRAPHVILLDLDLPRLNGLEVLRWIRQSYREPDVAVYLLTSSADSHDLQQAARAGVTKYFLKNRPFDVLIEGLDQLLEKVLSEGNNEVAARSKMMSPTVPKRGEDDTSALSLSPIFSLK